LRHSLPLIAKLLAALPQSLGDRGQALGHLIFLGLGQGRSALPGLIGELAGRLLRLLRSYLRLLLNLFGYRPSLVIS
jgi:hypothetical protein